MRRYFVIGNPIEHSLSPELHNFWIKKNNINAIYKKIKLEDTELKDPKSSLQEYIQKKYKSLPHYRTKESAGPDGNVRFYALCTVDEASLSCEGSGRTRKRAELDAANNMLEILDNYDSTA